jgi:hypothetical protein
MTVSSGRRALARVPLPRKPKHVLSAPLVRRIQMHGAQRQDRGGPKRGAANLQHRARRHLSRGVAGATLREERSPKETSLRVLLVVLVVLATLGVMGAESLSASSQLRLRPGIAWCFSGAWSSRQTLVLVDGLAERLLEYERSGLLRREIKSPSANLAIPQPVYIHAIPGGYWVETRRHRFVRLNAYLEPQEVVNVPAASKGPARTVAELYQWVPLGKGDRILAVGDVRYANGSQESGFLRLSLKDPASFQGRVPSAAGRSGAPLLRIRW